MAVLVLQSNNVLFVCQHYIIIGFFTIVAIDLLSAVTFS